MEQQFNNQFSSQPASQQPSRKTVRPFLLVILLVLVLALVGVLLLQNQITKLQGKNSNPTSGIVATVPNETAGQVYRNEIYGFEIKYPEQWSVQDTLPKIKKDTIGTENVEFFNDPFPTSVTRFVLYANPMGFGALCTIKYTININNDGSKISSADKGEDQCSSEYQKSHPNPTTDICSYSIRYACFGTPAMNNGNFYWGYLQSDTTGRHAISESDADALLREILFSFKTF